MLITLVYKLPKLSPESLTVAAEAIRGLRFRQGQWLVFVSDPEPMSVSVFRLTKETLAKATDETQSRSNSGEQKPLGPEDGKELLEWLQAQPFIHVESVEGGGLPSMLPSFPSPSPRPSLGMKAPSIQR